MAEYRRGDVILVWFPFTDLTVAKLRPAAVLASQGEDVFVIGIFSAVSRPLQETWLLIEERDSRFPKTGLKKSSVIKAEKIALLHRSVVHSKIGSLDTAHLDSLIEKVKKALQLP